MNKVSIVTANYENIEKQLKQSLESINYQPKKKKFLIKPNIVGPKDPDSPVITNPKVVIALIKFLKPFAEEIVIGEGSVAGTPTTKAFKAAGYEEIAKKYGVKLLDFDNCERIEKEWKYGKIKLPKILESHEYINVAKMKTHIQTMVTLAMKNQKGLLSDLDKKLFHKSGKLPDMIKALNETIQPDLNIIDAIACMEGNGPGAEGNLKTINKILTSTDIKAIDNAALKLMGIPLYKVLYMEKQEFELVGEEPKNYKFRLPDERYKKLNLNLWFNDSCSGCNHNIMASLKQLPKHPFKTIKFLYNITFNTTNIIAGPRHKSLPQKGKIICIGTCTHKLAKEKGCPYIEGCPPSIEDIVKKL